MKNLVLLLAILLASCAMSEPVSARDNDPNRDILVTFNNHGARSLSTGVSAPYRNRKRYSIAATARRDSDDVKQEYALVEIDHWPIRSLSVYCFVYRIPPGQDRDAVINQLRLDARVESVQPLQEFESATGPANRYDDTYANLQHGLSILDVGAAHRISRGQGVRVAIIDGDADSRHEDLRGRLHKIEVFVGSNDQIDAEHGTAVASVIGASANNATGIVGIAPEAKLELFVSCWADTTSEHAICDSFTLAKALDTLLDDPPDILNMSLTGPFDPLLARLLAAVYDAGVVVVAARPADTTVDNHFPAVLESVIGVGNSEQRPLLAQVAMQAPQEIYAPGIQIMVAVPNDSYDFRSGSSLAAAHVSGAVALLLAVSPGLPYQSVLALLRESQNAQATDVVSINACIVLQLADQTRTCQ